MLSRYDRLHIRWQPITLKLGKASCVHPSYWHISGMMPIGVIENTFECFFRFGSFPMFSQCNMRNDKSSRTRSQSNVHFAYDERTRLAALLQKALVVLLWSATGTTFSHLCLYLAKGSPQSQRRLHGGRLISSICEPGTCSCLSSHRKRRI